ncbi:LysR family transcriptional regulator [Acetonema longum]|uniref:LysR family transcriptional regulator n=1 Tax=Acetonema longum DSM 6540 TaxID=1009370 RepID=F7NNN1_9FIRM|nr:LysR family transcriptional regulator [Acetonema longum]EGO62351.1 LysR family transcriptional regulator [Acetonema longum DSM 6540]
MELRQLEYFQMVCQLNSISKAAEQLHIAQPSVTIAIQKLEEELGIQLFDRSQRQIALTVAGHVFSERVNEILNRVGDSVSEMKDLRLLQQGLITIGLPPMIGLSLFPTIFAQFQKQYPQFKITAIEGGSVTIQNLVEQGKIDIGFLTKTDIPPFLDTIPITKGQLNVCLHPGHPLSQLASIPFTQLQDQPFILLKKNSFHRQIILNECKKYQFTPRIVFSSSQVETIISLVELEVGISFLFDVIARRHSTIHSLPLTNPIHYQITLTWNRNRYLSNASKVFIDFMTSVYSRT